jgi:hypothetical protein
VCRSSSRARTSDEGGRGRSLKGRAAASRVRRSCVKEVAAVPQSGAQGLLTAAALSCGVAPCRPESSC